MFENLKKILLGSALVGGMMSGSCNSMVSQIGNNPVLPAKQGSLLDNTTLTQEQFYQMFQQFQSMLSNQQDSAEKVEADLWRLFDYDDRESLYVKYQNSDGSFDLSKGFDNLINRFKVFKGQIKNEKLDSLKASISSSLATMNIVSKNRRDKTSIDALYDNIAFEKLTEMLNCM